MKFLSATRALGCAVLAVLAAPPVTAQSAPVVQQTLRFPYDSGYVSNPSALEQVLSSQTIRVAQAAWIRLQFSLVLLDHTDESTGAFLRITSHRDGAVQELRTRHAREWRQTSAYFNGDTVQVEIVAPPHSGPSRVALRNVWIGPLVAGPQFSQCGATDDRVLSSYAANARLLPTNCSGFLIDDCNHCFATAGHCDNPYLQVAEFNVPLSTSFGTIVHPSPDDQYSVDGASVQSQNGGVGNDWAHFGVFANPNTGAFPFEAQAAFYTLDAAPPPFNASHVMRVAGYGIDNDDLDHTQVQQTSSGPIFSLAGTVLRYAVDTFGGDSGAPVTWENGTGNVVAIHTHGGCNTTSPNNGNWGTAIDQANFRAALGSPLGVCIPVASWSGYCTAKLNSQGCTPTISALGSPSASAGAGSFTIQAGQLINQQSGVLFYGSTSLAAPWKGGFLCVGSPKVRMALAATGGAPSGTDCSGSVSYDMGAHIAASGDPQLVCGATIYSQVWSRDPADAFHTNTTAGLMFTIGL